MTNRNLTACNRRLAQWRVTWLIEHSTSHQLLWCVDSFVLRNPPLRQAPKRYRQYYDCGIKERIKAITSTVQPLPNILNLCLSLAVFVYPKGTVCNFSQCSGFK